MILIFNDFANKKTEFEYFKKEIKSEVDKS